MDLRSELVNAADSLSPERTGITSRQQPPDPPCEQIGALDGFGLAAEGLDVRVNVYLYDRWGAGQDHAAAVKASAETAEYEAVIGVNGPLLFVGQARRGDDPAHFVLNDLCSAFSGHE